MACSQVSVLALALCVELASGFCVWKPHSVFIPNGRDRRNNRLHGMDEPKVYQNFSAAADACLMGKTWKNCREILCSEQECVAPADQHHAGMLYRPAGNCYRPLPSNGYCDRSSWYSGHPCNANHTDYCCEYDCQHCGPRSFCTSTFGEHSGICSPRHSSGRFVCPKYYQACSAPPNFGVPLAKGIGFNQSEPPPAPPAPLSAVQLGGGVKTKSCRGHSLSPITSLGICELAVQAMHVSSVTQCEDAKECSKRPYGCIVQKSMACPSCNPVSAMMNVHGQDKWCGVGNDEYDRFDCICMQSGNESMLGPVGGPPRPVDEAQAAAQKAEVAAAAAMRRAEEGLKAAVEVKEKQEFMYEQLEEELRQWKELAKQRQEWREGNASNAAQALSMQEQELRWLEYSWLPAILCLTGAVLVCFTISALVMLCCFTFGYARVAREAREPKISELQDAFVQADPTGEFSQM